jgi:hypothetical protein
MNSNSSSSLKALFSLLPSHGSSFDLVERPSPLEGERTGRTDRPLGEGSYDFLYQNGKPRLYAARTWFLELQDKDLQGLLDYYRLWRETPEYLVLQKKTWMGDHSETKTIAVKCSKRGNDVYFHKVKRRLSLFHKKDYEFFKPKDKDPRASVLFVTLTLDPKRITLKEAWETIGSEFNRWITGLRRKYGRIYALRTWEAMENGYPHVHSVLVFQDHAFQVWKQYKSGKTIWRIGPKEEFELWKGFTDVQAVKSYHEALSYLEKYILKDLSQEESPKQDLTLALCWIFRKRSFSVSRDLQKSINDLISNLHNSNQGYQKTIEGDSLEVTWVFIGIFTLEELGIQEEFRGKDPPWTLEIDPCKLKI